MRTRRGKLKAGIRKNGRLVSADQFGDRWPFTVDAGTVATIDALAVVFQVGKKVYGLNGMADSWFDTFDLAEIWRPDPDIPALRMDLDPVINFANAGR